MGLPAGGIGGIKLAAKIAWSARPGSAAAGRTRRPLAIVTEAGYAKRVPLADFPAQGRNGQGVVAAKLSDKSGDIAGALLVARTSSWFAALPKRAQGDRRRRSAGDGASRAREAIATLMVGEPVRSVCAVSLSDGDGRKSGNGKVEAKAEAEGKAKAEVKARAAPKAAPKQRPRSPRLGQRRQRPLQRRLRARLRLRRRSRRRQRQGFEGSENDGEDARHRREEGCSEARGGEGVIRRACGEGRRQRRETGSCGAGSPREPTAAKAAPPGQATKRTTAPRRHQPRAQRPHRRQWRGSGEANSSGGKTGEGDEPVDSRGQIGAGRGQDGGSIVTQGSKPPARPSSAAQLSLLPAGAATTESTSKPPPAAPKTKSTSSAPAPASKSRKTG